MRCGTHVLSWKYSRALVMDGNFKAEHMLLKNASQELWLMDGKGFMVTSEPYNRYLAGSVNRVEVRVIHYRGILSHPAGRSRIVAIIVQLIRQIQSGLRLHLLE